MQIGFSLVSYFVTKTSDRDFYTWQAYLTYDALSNDTKVANLVTLTVTLALNIPFQTLLLTGT